MSSAKILIVTPAAAGSRAGNRRTALRWARLLRGLGHRVGVANEWQGQPCDVLVVLHARRGHESLAAFHARHPRRPSILALTGTDLYRDIVIDAPAAASLTMATRLVALQERAHDALPAACHAKLRVIYQSQAATGEWNPPPHGLHLCVLGHLRGEKDPFRPALALQHLPRLDQVRVVHAGKALGADMAGEARQWMERESRYRWIGELTHGRTLRLLCSSHALVLPSLMEGGAHVASEAIACGVPVLASDISGNRGMLGDDYRGYFPVRDDRALAALIARAVDDLAFLPSLAAQVCARRPLVSPERERAAWQALLAELGLA